MTPGTIPKSIHMIFCESLNASCKSIIYPQEWMGSVFRGLPPKKAPRLYTIPRRPPDSGRAALKGRQFLFNIYILGKITSHSHPNSQVQYRGFPSNDLFLVPNDDLSTSHRLVLNNDLKQHGIRTKGHFRGPKKGHYLGPKKVIIEDQKKGHYLGTPCINPFIWTERGVSCCAKPDTGSTIRYTYSLTLQDN